MQHQTPNPASSRREPRDTPARSALHRTQEPQPHPDGRAREIPPTMERLQEILRLAPAAISVMEGPAHTVVVANPAFHELVGRREMLGRPAREALPELADQGIMSLLDRVLESGEAFEGTEMTVRLDRDGDGVLEEGVFDIVLEPLEHPDGTVFGVMCHATEVTEQVRTREQLAIARGEAERANRSKTDFLASMSHDLRTPLTAIAGYASLVAEGVYGPPTPGQRDAMSRIARANAHLLALIDDVLGFARIEGGGLALHIESLPVDEVLAGLEILIEPQIAAKGLSYEYRPGPSDARMSADRERVTQVILNLLSNALKFTDSGALRVEWEPTDTEVHIRVADSGRGIPQEMIGRIFDPFVQSASEGDRKSGVGLGLATSLGLARAMHGSLTVESEVGRGTVFTLTLPRT